MGNFQTIEEQIRDYDKIFEKAIQKDKEETYKKRYETFLNGEKDVFENRQRFLESIKGKREERGLYSYFVSYFDDLEYKNSKDGKKKRKSRSKKKKSKKS